MSCAGLCPVSPDARANDHAATQDIVGLQTSQEGEQLVVGPVPSGLATWWRRLVEKLLLQLEVGVQIDLRLLDFCTATIRPKLLKIGAAIVCNTRRVLVLLASAHPMKHVLITAARALSP